MKNHTIRSIEHLPPDIREDIEEFLLVKEPHFEIKAQIKPILRFISSRFEDFNTLNISFGYLRPTTRTKYSESQHNWFSGQTKVLLHKFLFEPDNDELLWSELLHELSHAICWQLYEQDELHGYYWGAIMLALGRNPYGEFKTEKAMALADYLKHKE